MKQRILTQSYKSKGYSWNMVLFGMLAFTALLWQRFTSTQTKNGTSPFLDQRQFADNINPVIYNIQFPGLLLCVTSTAIAYHAPNPTLAFLASLPLWGTSTVNAQTLPAVIDFNNTLPLNLGFMIQGSAAGDYTGSSVASAGDINADGKNDFLIGAPEASPGGRTEAGEVYLIYGSTNLGASINLDSLGSGGVILKGGTAYDMAGASVANAGDVNGDGYSDFLIGAYQATPSGRTEAGVVYLIYGSPNLNSTINLGYLGTAGVTLQGGSARDWAGSSVASAGDVNGDGMSDFIIGAYHASPDGHSQAGAAYLIYGSSNLPATIDLGNLGTLGVSLYGTGINDNVGCVASAGDVNGDGKNDFLIGAFQASQVNRSRAGAAYLIYGSTNLPAKINLGSLGTTGMTLFGGAAGDYAGSSVANTGDVNGDGYSDFLIGAYRASPAGRSEAGAVYLIHGAANLPTMIDLGKLGAIGVTLQGGAAHDFAGWSVANAGDINDDGYSDFIIGAYYASPLGRSQAGTAYLIFGAHNLSATIDLKNLGTAGVTLQGGAMGDYAGSSVSDAGDVNGDDRIDLLIGAFGRRNNAGAVYVIYGPRPTESQPTVIPIPASTPALTSLSPQTTTLNPSTVNLPAIIGGATGTAVALGIILATCGIWCKKNKQVSAATKREKSIEKAGLLTSIGGSDEEGQAAKFSAQLSNHTLSVKSNS